MADQDQDGTLRAAQIQAVRGVLGWEPGSHDDQGNDIDQQAERLVDAVLAAGRPPIGRGFGRRNPHCSNCGDERGGPFGHETSECRYRDGMPVADLVHLPHLAERQAEVWDHYVDRYFAEEPIRREAHVAGYAAAVANCRDDAGYDAWVRRQPDTQPRRWTRADYLEAVGPSKDQKLTEEKTDG